MGILTFKQAFSLPNNCEKDTFLFSNFVSSLHGNVRHVVPGGVSLHLLSSLNEFLWGYKFSECVSIVAYLQYDLCLKLDVSVAKASSCFSNYTAVEVNCLNPRRWYTTKTHLELSKCNTHKKAVNWMAVRRSIEWGPKTSAKFMTSVIRVSVFMWIGVSSVRQTQIPSLTKMLINKSMYYAYIQSPRMVVNDWDRFH